jgi:hypothetical protein
MGRTPPCQYGEKNKRAPSNMAGLGYFVYHTSGGGVWGIDVTPL